MIGRHYGLDWLRVGAFALLIFYHVGMYFVPWGWHVKSDEILPWATVPMFALNPWRLSLLFVVSGYASRAVLAKMAGPGAFARSRTARLMVPTLFAVIFIIPSQPWTELVTQHGYRDSFAFFWLHDYFRFGSLEGIVLPTWQHLWFVVYLWAYTLLLAALLAFIPAPIKAGLMRMGERLLGGWRLLALPFLYLLAVRALLYPIFGETHALVDDWANHAVYVPMFLFGFALAGTQAFWPTIVRWWKLAAFVAAAGYAVFIAVYLGWPGDAVPPQPIILLARAGREAQAWGAIIALLGLAHAHWNRDHAARRYLTEAVFPWYIIHQTVIVAVGFWMLGSGLGTAAEFVILIAATALSCWAFYAVGRRIEWLRPFIGLRRRSGVKPSGRLAPSTS
jgi:hypothetical protein